MTESLVVEIPIKVENESNLRGKARNPFRLSRNTADQKSAVRWSLALPLRRSGLVRPTGPCAVELLHAVVVTLERLAPRAYDDDGTVNSLKHIRDGVAECLGLRSDRDKRVTWRYGHDKPLQRGAATLPGVRIAIARREPPEAASTRKAG
jgi:hypothetical protein